MRGRITSLTAVLLFGCGGDDDGTGPGGLTLAPASSSGNTQTGSPGAVLAPFRVRLSKNNNPVEGSIINWTVASGSGRLSVPTSVTDASGTAEATLTLGLTAGQTTVHAEATAANGTQVTFTGIALIPGVFVQVAVEDNIFLPGSVTIQPGGMVLWVWDLDARHHNIEPVSPGTQPRQSAMRDGPFSYEETFSTAGTYRYFCSQHVTAGGGMRGEVVVH